MGVILEIGLSGGVRVSLVVIDRHGEPENEKGPVTSGDSSRFR